MSSAPALWPTQSAGPRITTFAGTGQEAVSEDGSSSRSTALASIDGLAVSQSGDLYMADAYRVRRVHDGVVSTVAGSSSNFPGFSGDGGPALQAQLSIAGAGGLSIDRGTSGLALDRVGNLFITDTGNNRVRKVTPDLLIILSSS